jgi:hypothetical protein
LTFNDSVIQLHGIIFRKLLFKDMNWHICAEIVHGALELQGGKPLEIPAILGVNLHSRFRGSYELSCFFVFGHDKTLLFFIVKQKGGPLVMRSPP